MILQYSIQKKNLSKTISTNLPETCAQTPCAQTLRTNPAHKLRTHLAHKLQAQRAGWPKLSTHDAAWGDHDDDDDDDDV